MPSRKAPPYLLLILGLLVAAILSRAFLGRPVRVVSAAMEPALLVGDVVWVDRAREVEPGDVVAWEREEGDLSLSRVVATEGQVVEVVGGRLYLDGQPEAGEGIRPGGLDSPALALPVGAVFLLGDHRARSSDSRHWGTVPVQALRGRARWVLWSRDQQNGSLRWQRLARPVR